MATKKVDNTKPKKENNTATPPREGFLHKTRRVLQDERTRFIGGLLLLMFSIFLTISFISFFFSGAADQSIIDHHSAKSPHYIGNGIHSWMGLWGAYCADLFINRWIGISAFFIVFFLGGVGLKLMKVITFSTAKALAYTAAFCIIVSLACGFFFLHLYEDTHLFLGGYQGYYVTLWLESAIGWPGTLLLIIAGILLLAIAINRRTISALRYLFRMDFIKRKKKEPVVTPEAAANDALQEEENGESIEKTPSDIEMTIIDATASDSSEPEAAAPAAEMPYPFDTPAQEDFTLYNPTPDELTETPEEPEGEEKKPNFEIKAGEEEAEATEQAKLDKYDPTLDLSHYAPPSFDLLKPDNSSGTNIDIAEQEANKQRIITTLENYGIRISSIKATVGPTVTLYEIVPEAGIKISRIKNLEDDIALSLAALGIRIIAPIPGKGTVGIEVPNHNPQTVMMRPIIASQKFQECTYELPLALGKTITNEIFMVDLCKMPHILVAGATGQGKSVGLNAIITSLLYKKHPSQLKFVMVDPKKVEFSLYSSIERHFLAKLPDSEDAIITETDKVVQTLNSVCVEMDSRFKLLQLARVHNIKEYNDKFIARQLNPEKGHRYMPYLVVVIDEFGDLIMTAGREVEMPIARIAQLGRAAGLHMIIATQRPSTNIITGSIKANFPARIAFKVASMIDSRTILDTPGANQLIGKGDMLISCNGGITRVQCAFIDTPEVEGICQYIGAQQGYPTAYLLPEYVSENSGATGNADDLKDRDPFFEDAARLIVANQQGSTSLIQRKFAIGYNRAGRLMDQLEAAGIVGPFEGSKARQVLVMDDMHLDQILESLR